MLASVIGTGRSGADSSTAGTGFEPTSTLPSASTISPRGGWIGTGRSALTLAALRYWLPDRTCRYQSRKKMIANIASAQLPMIATRSASCGVIGGTRFSDVLGGSIIASDPPHRAGPTGAGAG